MHISINGQTQQTTAQNILELVTLLELDTNSLVVEYNRRIIKQEKWEQTPLHENDELELLSFVGGG